MESDLTIEFVHAYIMAAAEDLTKKCSDERMQSWQNSMLMAPFKCVVCVIKYKTCKRTVRRSHAPA